MHDVPIGIQASGLRREQDLTGSIDVPADRYWGAGTQRALAAGEATACPMPDSLFRCYGYLRRAAVIIATQAGRLPPWKAAGRRFALLRDEQFFTYASWAELAASPDPMLHELLTDPPDIEL